MSKSHIDILIVEDSPEDLDIYRRMLKQHREKNYMIAEADLGEEALKLCLMQRPDCIVLDFNLPDLNGLEFLDALEKESGGAPYAVVMLTGHGNEAVATEAMKKGALDYLVKGQITAESLRLAIEHAIARTNLNIALTAKQAELERSNRELEQYARVVAHDLKTPLYAINGYLDYFVEQMKGKVSEEDLAPLASAMACARRMDNLIKDILSYSRLDGEKSVLETVEMDVIMGRVVENLQADIQHKNAKITHPALPAVVGNAGQLTQLLQNLIGNALKFCDTNEAKISVNVKKAHGEWLFCVEDNGIGFDARDAERIFLAFERVHSRSDFPGTGLGLAICKKIVEMHRGIIWAESEPTKGSRFYFTLPAIDENA